MTDRSQDPEIGADTGMDYDRESTTGIPRWVKVVGIVLAVAVLLFIVMLLVGNGGGGGHGPARHTSGDGGANAAIVCGSEPAGPGGQASPAG